MTKENAGEKTETPLSQSAVQGIVKCAACKWWGLKPDYLDEDDHHDPTDQLPGGEGHKNCEHPKVGGGSYGDDARRRKDALNTYECVGTGPEFGCIHGESINDIFRGLPFGTLSN